MTEVAVEQSSVLGEEIEQRMEMVLEQSSNHTEFVQQEEIEEQRMEVVLEQSSNLTESVLEEETEQRAEVEVEQSSQVTEFVKEETESGESVMSVEETESAGAETFQPSPSRTTGRNIPDSLSLPLESQAASTQFWTANSARK